MSTTEDTAVERALVEFARAGAPAELLAIVRTIAAAGDPRGTEPLIRALTFNDAAFHDLAIDGLTAIGEPAVEPLLASLDGMDYGARYRALRALVAIGDPRARPAYEYWLGADIIPGVRCICVKGLARFPDTEPLLLKALEDKVWVVRYYAIQMLFERGLTPFTHAALEALATDPERVVRLKLAQIFAQVSAGS
ncbi:HEAT repeat domain-containing protein [Gloeobacter violaceus]|uniref:Phycocyanobilin lyase alpha subunit n=1 Tax=Gloeobacter violaceus (strain ATCC 29082 / PCC 7421) TaxID=251221 RepID=Q7NL57_GLOVI|nr:HEAT repeat domain-containing protein [Gloeobacter violaceus]BAC89210.1 phycocyanobilin lyase alpha subunit [Gloeobacter violaceus PCC 7421]